MNPIAYEDTHLIHDAQIARMLCVSRSWVRKQRFCRRHNLIHVFNIDPVFVGTAPRYRLAEVLTWIESLNPANDNGAANSSEKSHDN